MLRGAHRRTRGVLLPFPRAGRRSSWKGYLNNSKVLIKLFQKFARFGAEPHRSLAFRKRRKGAKTVRWTVLAWGTLAGGSPKGWNCTLPVVFGQVEPILWFLILNYRNDLVCPQAGGASYIFGQAEPIPLSFILNYRNDLACPQAGRAPTFGIVRK